MTTVEAERSELLYESWSLKETTDFASKVAYRMATFAPVMVGVKFGVEDQRKLTFNWMRGHQLNHFLGDLETLGIDPHNLPVAVACARYHYLSNAVGGLAMEYVEETPQKVWVRYDISEDEMYAGLDARAERATFDAWHANNCVLLDSIGVKNAMRVGVVVTKLPADGESMMECYFKEYDHELEPYERVRYQVPASRPDSTHYGDAYIDMLREHCGVDAYPLERIYRQNRAYCHYCSEDMELQVLHTLGAANGFAVLEHCWRLIGSVDSRQWRAELGIEERGARGMALFMKAMGDVQEERTEIEEVGENQYVVRKFNTRHFKKRLDEIDPRLFAVQNVFWETAADCMRVPVVGPHVKVTPTKSLVEGDECFEWVVRES